MMDVFPFCMGKKSAAAILVPFKDVNGKIDDERPEFISAQLSRAAIASDCCTLKRSDCRYRHGVFRGTIPV